jgi:hypothetical protein
VPDPEAVDVWLALQELARAVRLFHETEPGTVMVMWVHFPQIYGRPDPARPWGVFTDLHNKLKLVDPMDLAAEGSTIEQATRALVLAQRRMRVPGETQQEADAAVDERFRSGRARAYLAERVALAHIAAAGEAIRGANFAAGATGGLRPGDVDELTQAMRRALDLRRAAALPGYEWVRV